MKMKLGTDGISPIHSLRWIYTIAIIVVTVIVLCPAACVQYEYIIVQEEAMC
jgi:hypothetical protein